MLFAAHRSAYLIVKCAERTLNWISTMNEPSREFYWNWAANQYAEYSWMWGGEMRTPVARLASLAFWFGPYSLDSWNSVKYTFRRMVDAYENGTYTLGRRTMTYHCADVCSPATAQHWNNPYTRVCQFWNDCCPDLDSNWGRFRVESIVHEWFHGIRALNRPHDVCAWPCHTSEGWACKWGTSHSHQCYQRRESSETWDYTLDNGGPPRRLIEDGRIKEAHDNVDNFVSWALARWADRQWGPCNGPVLPTTASDVAVGV